MKFIVYTWIGYVNNFVLPKWNLQISVNDIWLKV